MTENDDMSNTYDEMTNKRILRDVQKYLYLQIHEHVPVNCHSKASAYSAKTGIHDLVLVKE